MKAFDIFLESEYPNLLHHPDFLWNYPWAKKIKRYRLFSYAANETLHLSEKEKFTIISIFKIIENENQCISIGIQKIV